MKSCRLICAFILSLLCVGIARAETATCTPITPGTTINIDWNIAPSTHAILINLTRKGTKVLSDQPTDIIINQEDITLPYHITAMSLKDKTETIVRKKPPLSINDLTKDDQEFWELFPEEQTEVNVKQTHFWNLFKKPNTNSDKSEIWTLKYTIVRDANSPQTPFDSKKISQSIANRDFKCVRTDKMPWPTLNSVNQSIAKFSIRGIKAIACELNVCRIAENKGYTNSYGRCYNTANAVDGEFMFGWDWDSFKAPLVTTEAVLFDANNNRLNQSPPSIFIPNAISDKNPEQLYKKLDITVSSANRFVNNMQVWNWKKGNALSILLYCLVQNYPFTDYVHAGELMAKNQIGLTENDKGKLLPRDIEDREMLISDAAYIDAASLVRIHMPPPVPASSRAYQPGIYSCMDRENGVSFNWALSPEPGGGFTIHSDAPVVEAPKLILHDDKWTIGEISFRYSKNMPNYNKPLDEGTTIRFAWAPDGSNSSWQSGDSGWGIERFLPNGQPDSIFNKRGAGCKRLEKSTVVNYPFVTAYPDNQLPTPSTTGSSSTPQRVTGTHYRCYVINSAGNRINKEGKEDPNANPVLSWVVNDNIKEKNRVSMLKPRPHIIEQLNYDTYTNGKILGLQFYHKYCASDKNYSDFWVIVQNGPNRWKLEVTPDAQLITSADEGGKIETYPLDCSIGSVYKDAPPAPQCLSTKDNRLLTLFY